MSGLGRTLIVVGLGIAALGVLLALGGKVGFLGRLPGDIVVERPGYRFYLPLTTSLLISILLSLLLWLFRK